MCIRYNHTIQQVLRIGYKNGGKGDRYYVKKEGDR